MAKLCDNKSVGMLVKNGRDELLLIERKQYNFGFAPPAGHLDGDSWEDAAKKELREEVGLAGARYKFILEQRMRNPCKREGGGYHLWRVYEVGGLENENVKPSEDETRGYLWADRAKLRELASRSEEFIRKNGLSLDDLPAVVAATNASSEWRANPGLEPPWYVILKELGMV